MADETAVHQHWARLTKQVSTNANASATCKKKSHLTEQELGRMSQMGHNSRNGDMTSVSGPDIRYLAFSLFI